MEVKKILDQLTTTTNTLRSDIDPIIKKVKDELGPEATATQQDVFDLKSQLADMAKAVERMTSRSQEKKDWKEEDKNRVRRADGKDIIPDTWGGSDDKSVSYSSFRDQVQNWAAAICPGACGYQGKIWLERAASIPLGTEVDLADLIKDSEVGDVSDELIKSFEQAVWQILSRYTKGEAQATVKSTEWGCGLRAWHGLSHEGAPHTNTDRQASRRAVSQTRPCKDEGALAKTLPLWLAAVADHDRRLPNSLDDNAKLDALITMLPRDLFEEVPGRDRG